MTASGVRSRVPEELSTPMLRNKPTTDPWSPRIVFHARVRIRKLVKNGTTTSPSSAFLKRPPRNAITYARGYATTSAMIVASAAYTKERVNWPPYRENALLKFDHCHANTGFAKRLGRDESAMRPSV